MNKDFAPRARAALRAAAACALLAACTGDPVRPGDPNAAHTLRADYAGPAHTGSVDAAGRFPGDSKVHTRSFATGISFRSINGVPTVAVVGSEWSSGSSSDVLELSIGHPTVGTHTCEPGTFGCLFSIELTLGQNWGDIVQFDGWYRMTSGQVRIDELTGSRIRGEFSGVLRSWDDLHEVTITGGRFDVEVYEREDVPP